MGKTKQKKAKANGENNGSGSNPFESTTNGNNTAENENYPKDINPFLKKPTKSMKKAKKDWQKKEKMEEKLKKKQEKAEKNGKTGKNKEQIVVQATEISTKYKPKKNDNQSPREGGKVASSRLPPIRTPDAEPKTNVSQTLDHRAPPTEKSPQPPQLRDKRILQLKSDRHSAPPGVLQAPHPEPTKKATYKYSPSQGRRPQSLELQYQPTAPNRSPRPEHRAASPLVQRAQRQHPADDGEVKMYRTASISKKSKADKKKRKKMKKMLKKKQKSKNKLLEDQEVVDNVVMRNPTKLETLQREVEETKESVRSSVINLVEGRNRELDSMLQNVRELEENAHGFATVAQETRLKKQASATCCGLWKNWKICWYVCACQRGIKKKKKWDSAHSGKETHELLSRRATADQDDDGEDYYRPADKTTTAEVLPRPQSSAHSIGGSSSDSANSTGIRGKLGKLPNAVRMSLSALVDDKTPMGGSSRDLAPPPNGRLRKSSSVSALHEIVKAQGAKKKQERKKKQKEKGRERKEKEISEFASQYEDEETRNKVQDLLRLDLESPGTP